MKVRLLSREEYHLWCDEYTKKEKKTSYEEWNLKADQIENALSKFGRKFSLRNPEEGDFDILSEFQDAPYVAAGFFSLKMYSREILEALATILKKEPRGFSISIEAESLGPECPISAEVLLTEEEGILVFGHGEEVESKQGGSEDHLRAVWVKTLKGLVGLF